MSRGFKQKDKQCSSWSERFFPDPHSLSKSVRGSRILMVSHSLNFISYLPKYQLLIHIHLKTSLTLKCPTEHPLADPPYSRPLDTYLWKQMMKTNRNITHKWCNTAKKHPLLTKRKCHKPPWPLTAPRRPPRRRPIRARRTARKAPASIGPQSPSPSPPKKGLLPGKPYPEIRWPSPVPFYKHGFQRRKPPSRKPKPNEQRPTDTSTSNATPHAQTDPPPGEQRDTTNNHENPRHPLPANNRYLLSTSHHMRISPPLTHITRPHKQVSRAIEQEKSANRCPATHMKVSEALILQMCFKHFGIYFNFC